MNYGAEINNALTDEFDSILSAHIVRWRGRPFDTPTGVNWLSFAILMGGTFEQTLKDTDRVNGIVQIDCYMPKFTGEDFAFTVADLLNTQLPKNGTPITSGSTDVHIKTIKQPRISQDDNWHRMIIDISFYAFVDRV